MTAAAARRLAKEALALNESLGDPLKDAQPKSGSRAKAKRSTKSARNGGRRSPGGR